MALPTATHDDFWAITSYFNPMRYARRRSNFRIFRERLNVPLIAVELAYADEFELKEQDADILIRLRGSAILWQKERLLNLGLRALPPHCRKVAWVDCDIIFDTADWAASAKAMLDQRAIVQMFSRVKYLPAAWTPEANCSKEADFEVPSFAFCITSELSAANCIAGTFDRRQGTCVNGFAWAARREILDRHGLYDASIVGGGDTALAAAATKCFDTVVKCHYMNRRQQDLYMAWANPFYETVRGNIGFLDKQIYHLWHGHIENRRAHTRHKGLWPFKFDPFTDIAIDTNGCWRWNTQKPELHEYVRQYFLTRQEDG